MTNEPIDLTDPDYDGPWDSRQIPATRPKGPLTMTETADARYGTATSNALAHFRVDVDPDRNQDPYLICTECDEVICTVEHDDTLDVLAATALAHRKDH